MKSMTRGQGQVLGKDIGQGQILGKNIDQVDGPESKLRVTGPCLSIYADRVIQHAAICPFLMSKVCFLFSILAAFSRACLCLRVEGSGRLRRM